MVCNVMGSTFLRWTCDCLLSLSPLINIALKHKVEIYFTVLRPGWKLSPAANISNTPDFQKLLSQGYPLPNQNSLCVLEACVQAFLTHTHLLPYYPTWSKSCMWPGWFCGSGTRGPPPVAWCQLATFPRRTISAGREQIQRTVSSPSGLPLPPTSSRPISQNNQKIFTLQLLTRKKSSKKSLSGNKGRWREISLFVVFLVCVR